MDKVLLGFGLGCLVVWWYEGAEPKVEKVGWFALGSGIMSALLVPFVSEPCLFAAWAAVAGGFAVWSLILRVRRIRRTPP